MPLNLQPLPLESNCHRIAIEFSLNFPGTAIELSTEFRILTSSVKNHQQQLDEQLNALKNSIVKQLSEKTNQDNLLLSLEMNAQTSSDSSETFSILFSSIERRLFFESKLNEVKQQLSGKEILTPLFLREIALPKTRAGLLFCCASATLPFKSNLIVQQSSPATANNPTLNINQRLLDKALNNAALSAIQNSILPSTLPGNAGLNASSTSPVLGAGNAANSSTSTISSCLQAPNEQDVWICNSDGYVGQVCVLSLSSDPTVTSCNGVCNSRILCIVAVPAYR